MGRERKQQYRQGDVLLVPVGWAPEGCRPISPDHGRFVLAYGEATGHAHALATDSAEFFQEENGPRRFLLIRGGKSVELRHEEHAPVSLLPGLYEVQRQREYRDGERTWEPASD